MDEARLLLSVAFPPRKMSADEASAEKLVWRMALMDASISGGIPKWAVSEAVKSFLGGNHGPYHPSVAEFVQVCKRKRDDLRRTVWECERMLNARVVEERTVTDAARARVEELMKWIM